MGSTKTATKSRPKYTAKSMPSVWGLSPELKYQLKIVPQSALSDFIGGHPVDEWHWNALAFRVHVGASLSDLAFPDTAENFVLAIKALDRSRASFEAVGEWNLTPNELVAIGDALNFTDQLQEITTRAEQRQRGIELVRKNVKDIRRIGLVSMESALRWIK